MTELKFEGWEKDGDNGWYSFDCPCGGQFGIYGWWMGDPFLCDGCHKIYTNQDFGEAINRAVEKEPE